ncbi:MAG: signal peptidase II [Terriglobales bacterium]
MSPDPASPPTASATGSASTPASPPVWFRTRFFVIALVVFCLDQITKGIIQRMPERVSITVIPHFFYLVHVENAGAAFGLFQASPSPFKSVFLIGFSVLALVVVFILLWRHSQTARTGWALALIFGGACGNLFDRVLRGSVVDFLLFNLGRYEWPAFNIADSAICIGAALLVWEILRSQSAAPAPAAPEPRPES